MWLAHCKPLNTTVAVKLVELEELQTQLDLLIKEAHTMMTLRHPNVLHLHCSFIHEETLWLVMPYISGGTLSTRLRTQVSPDPSHPVAMLANTFTARIQAWAGPNELATRKLHAALQRGLIIPFCPWCRYPCLHAMILDLGMIRG